MKQVFPVGFDSQGVPSDLYRGWVCSAVMMQDDNASENQLPVRIWI